MVRNRPSSMCYLLNKYGTIGVHAALVIFLVFFFGEFELFAILLLTRSNSDKPKERKVMENHNCPHLPNVRHPNRTQRHHLVSVLVIVY
jgi:hypothetical protein